MANTDKAPSLGRCQPGPFLAASPHSLLPMVYREGLGYRLPPLCGSLGQCKLRSTGPGTRLIYLAYKPPQMAYLYSWLAASLLASALALHQPWSQSIKPRLYVRSTSEFSGLPSDIFVGSQGDPWTSSILTTVGYHLGHTDSILHPIWSIFHRRRSYQRPPGHFGFPYPMGGPDRASCYPFRRDVLPTLQYVIKSTGFLALPYANVDLDLRPRCASDNLICWLFSGQDC